MGAVAEGAHAVEGGNADSGGEISVRTAADSGFLEFPVNVSGERRRFFIEGDDACVTFHGQAVDTAADFQLAMLVYRLESAEAAIDTGGLFGALDAHIDFDDGVGGDHVCARAAADHSGIDGQATLQVIPLPHFGDLVREFEDGAVSFAGVETGVGGDAMSGEEYSPTPLRAVLTAPRGPAGSRTRTAAD